jgi:putative hydrolase of the HAD superfamily
VLFDADGVLQRAPGDVWTRLTAALGASPSDIELCTAEIFAAEVPALVGSCDFADALAPVLAKWNAPCDAPAFLAQWLSIDVDQSVLGVIADLRMAGVHCALASNQEANRARYMSERLAYRNAFDREFYSCDLRHKKPSPEYFAELLRLGGFEAGRTLFIDDRADNVEAARAAGLQAARFVLAVVGEGAAPMRELLAGYGL